MSNEWALVDRLIAQRDRLAEALRMVDKHTEGWSYGMAHTVIENIRRTARAVLAECAGTPTEGQDDE